MTPRDAAERLRRAEVEFRAAQVEHDGSDVATERYRAALSELKIAERVGRAVIAAVHQ